MTILSAYSTTILSDIRPLILSCHSLWVVDVEGLSKEKRYKKH